MKKLLLSVVAAFCITASPAQSFEELLAPVHSCCERGNRAMEAKRYAEAEREYREAIRLFETLPDSVRTQLDEWNYGGYLRGEYYNLACAQSRLNKRRAAVASLAAYVDCGNCDYSWMIEDPDLDNIRSERGYAETVEKAREQGDFMWILRQAGPYDSSAPTDSLPRFRYADPNDRDLVRVREYFNLDSIAGAGDEISKIKNLLAWVHNTIRHDGSSYNPEEKNAIALYEICKKEDRGVNCRMMAQMLNECYLAMGFKSRYVTCLPKSYINDCHVINVVYSNTLDKWLWVDPTWNAYVMDDKGNLLSISEVRDRLKKGEFVTVNEDANWNHKTPCTNDYYLDYYMSKNLYYLQCSDCSGFNNETYVEGKRRPVYITLSPTGEPYDKRWSTSNESWFWASPYK